LHKNFKILSVLDGNGAIISGGKNYKAKKGDTYFIPAGLEIMLEGDLEILKSFL
jgi:mannose-6-phosphate isomerase